MTQHVIARKLAALEAQVSDLTEDTIQSDEAVQAVVSMLLTRQGEVITPELALERARNIVAGLFGLRIGGQL